MPATRGQKRQNGDTHYDTEPSTQSIKRSKLTNHGPLHTLLEKYKIEISYGWGIVSFYNKEGNLISSDKLIKYEVDPTLKIARYKAKEFPFNYIEYEDYIISFDEFKKMMMSCGGGGDTDDLKNVADEEIDKIWRNNTNVE